MPEKSIGFTQKILIAIGFTASLSACNTISEKSSPLNANDIAFSQVLQSNDRSDADKKRDTGRKPIEVMQFFGIEPGMTVLEVLSSGGYYTEILSARVGKQGKVIAQNNKFILEIMEGRFNKEFAKRTADNRLANVEHYIKEFGDFNLYQQVDVATVVLNYHDLYSNAPKTMRLKILSQLKAALKPGGILSIIDMEAGKGVHQPNLHRIYHQRVRDELAEAGFILDAEANFLKNPNDDYKKIVFDPSVRGKTDRFVFRFKKPV